jgi:hypothetical protein
MKADHMPALTSVSVRLFLSRILLTASLAIAPAFAAESPTLGPELLTNGNLADGDMNWTLETHEGAQGHLTILENGYEKKPALVVTAEVTEPEAKLWTIQLSQRELSFKKGEKYRLTFAAKSSDGKWAYATLGETTPPYGSVCTGSQIKLSQDWQVFSYDFTVTKDTPYGRLIFTNLNTGGQSRSFAAISLKHIGQ